MKKLIAILIMTMATGCAIGTPSMQIAGIYVSDRTYQDMTCEEAMQELKNVTYREKMLVRAQNKRVEINMLQAFWVGFGNGDGIEASELAQIRGHRVALIKQINMIDGCEITKDIQQLLDSINPPKKVERKKEVKTWSIPSNKK